MHVCERGADVLSEEARLRAAAEAEMHRLLAEQRRREEEDEMERLRKEEELMEQQRREEAQRRRALLPSRSVCQLALLDTLNMYTESSVCSTARCSSRRRVARAAKWCRLR